ncbi:Harbinger transposase-derived nuclease domain - like 10 [Theobroma cacao]|nr:Harbinger transposase-derived nuclease domain - like 10 [Theobroma cacao]
MSKPTFSQLLSTLSLSFPPSFPIDSSLAAALFRLVHGACYKFLARRFSVSSSANACPNISRIVVGFGWISLPNYCGILGFGRFEVDGQLMGSSGSVLVQALVDSEGRFLDISTDWPCSIKPESILHQTKLFLELLNGPCYKLGNGNSVPQYILGDSCFPLMSWLITPYLRTNEEGDSLGSPEGEFNAVHSRAMGLVERAFGRVRVSWQLFSKRWKVRCVEYLPFRAIVRRKCGGLKGGRRGVEAVSEEDVDERGQRIRDAVAQHLNRSHTNTSFCLIS